MRRNSCARSDGTSAAAGGEGRPWPGGGGRNRGRQADGGRGGWQEPGGPPRRARGGQAGDLGRAHVKVLALDYGRARTGVAVSDPPGTIARPLGVVERAGGEQGLAELAKLIEHHDPECVVVGLPLTLRGT